MRKIKKSLVTGFMFISLLNNSVIPTTAQVSPEVMASTQYLKELSKAEQGLYFEETDSGPIIKDKSGETRYGWQYDMVGNLYYMTQDGKMIRSGTNSDGIYFDENGRYINPAMREAERNDSLSKQFESGKTLKFENQERLLDFLEYYSVQYRYLDDADNFTVINNSDGTKRITIPEDRKYDREALIQRVISQFGPLEGETDYEKIMDGCQKVTGISYDLSYINEDLEKSLTDGKGVCRHYAKCMKILLDDAGIKNEIMVGNYNGSPHMWLRCFVNDEWCYVDPTAASQIWWNYSNMPYETFITSYVPLRSMTLT